MLQRPDRAPDRRARHRQRARDGRRCYQVELGGEELEFLIRTQWLAEAEASDRLAVGSAVARLIAASARR
jgi:hypothetical protein